MSVEVGEAMRPTSDSETAPAGASTAVTFVKALRILIVAAWLGATIFFSFVVAPSAFAVLPTRELAGTVVARILTAVNTSGFLIALLALVTLPLVWRRASLIARIVEALALIVVAGATGIGQFVIATRLHALRAQLSGPVESLGQTDPVRMAFNDLHGYSVTALSVAMLAALVTYVMMSAANRGS
jgi:hypothetical protein